MTPTTPPTSGETPDRGGGVRWAERFVLVGLAALGTGGGALLLLVPAPVRPLAAQSVLLGLQLANVAVLLAGSRHRRRVAEAAERGAPPEPVVPGVPLLRRQPVQRAYAALLGLVVASLCVLAGSGVPGVVLGAAVVLVVLVALPLLALSRRRRLASARAVSPGATVVLVALAELAPMRLAQWARATGTVLPATLGNDLALVADAEGVGLRRPARAGRPLPRWGWDDVDLARAHHPSCPDPAGAAVLVLTLLGPEPPRRSRAVPVGRRRFEVTLAVLHGWRTAGPEVVDAALAELLAHRPPVAGAPPTDPSATRAPATGVPGLPAGRPAGDGT